MTFWYRSVPVTNGSVSGSCYFFQWASRKQQKITFFCVLFEGTFTSYLKDKKVIKKWQNSKNKDFSYYFCLMIEGSWSGSVPLLTNGSGSATLVITIECFCRFPFTQWLLRVTVQGWRVNINLNIIPCLNIILGINFAMFSLICQQELFIVQVCSCLFYSCLAFFFQRNDASPPGRCCLYTWVTLRDTVT